MSLIVAVLVLLSVGAVSLQELSVSDAEIEKRNGCKCLQDYVCDANNKFNPFTSNFPGRAKFPKIKCNGDGMRCCKVMPTDNTPTVTERNPDPGVTPVPSITPRRCGNSKLSTVAKQGTPGEEITDEFALDGEFPWLVAIFKKELSGAYDFRCGGTLIHPKVVLTAYHCIYKNKPSDVLVRATGKKEIPTAGSETRSVSEIVKHPRYFRHPRLYYDAALLFLDTPFEIGNPLNTLCLPPPNPPTSFEGCIVAGWGDLNGKRNTLLKRIEIPFIDRTRCQQLLRKTDVGPNFSLHESFMCAGNEEGKDSCLRDGGGPLMCEIPSEPERYFQAGIVSWGVGCGQRDVPGVYTDVEKVSEWIKTQLTQRNLEAS